MIDAKCILRSFILTAVLAASGFSQSEAQNGRIEGTVIDTSGAAIASASITLTNTDTGSARNGMTDENGAFRFLLLPIGRYRITTAAVGFRTLHREGIILVTGQTIALELTLNTGDVREDITVTADAPVADAGKIEQGRVMNSAETKSLPLLQNPYSFVFLQSNVTGNRLAVPGLGFANVNANGFSRRGSYQIDGNYATDVTSGGVRMLFMSRPYIQEIQLLTGGMNAEFGGTTGHVMNMLTPSGSNDIHGEISYQFRRHGFAARPFNTAPGPIGFQPVADIFTAAMSGPLKRNRWHFYAGFEASNWDLASASRAINLAPGVRQSLIAAGVPETAMPPAYDAPERYRFYIARSDLRLNSSNRLGIRLLLTEGTTEKLGIGPAAGNMLQLTRDNQNLQSSLAVQLVSYKGESLFNELRFQRSARDTRTTPNEFTGSGEVSIRIDGVAGFGAPPDGQNAASKHRLTTLQNNLSISRNGHAVKAGVGHAGYAGNSRSKPSALYTFSTLQSYIDAANGIDRRGYRLYSDTFGVPDIETKAVFWNAFVQNEWRVTDRIRINMGLRYDLFTLPDADPTAAYSATRKFHTDKNNFGPRLGFAASIGRKERPAVIRLSAGIYYDPPILNYYQQALENSGNPEFFSFTFGPIANTDVQAGPEFPLRFTDFPQDQALPLADIDAIDPNFKTMSALQANFQFEKAFAENYSFTIAFNHSSGRHIPTSRQVNCLPTGGTLADGRPLYGDLVVGPNGRVIILPCTKRILPQFDQIWVWESVGNLEYDAATFSLTKRLSSGFQASINYTIGRTRDDAPEENINAAAQWQTDASNRRHDRSVSLSDQRHTFVATAVAQPRFSISSRILKFILNGSQFALIARATSGERQNIRTDADLNRDGGQMDRPVGIRRNFIETPAFFNVDLRISRQFNFRERHRLEVFADIVNLTNTNSIIGYNNTVISASNVNTSMVDPLSGVLRGPLPDLAARGVTSTDSRRVQLGIKYSF